MQLPHEIYSGNIYVHSKMQSIRLNQEPKEGKWGGEGGVVLLEANNFF